MLNERELQNKSTSELLEIILQQQNEAAVQGEKITSLKAKVISQESLISQLNEALKLNRSRQFGKRSERDTDTIQLSIFNEAEVTQIDDEQTDEDAMDNKDGDVVTVPSHQRKKRRAKLPEALPRIEVLHDLTQEQKQCPCGCIMACIGDERSEQLDIIPAKVQVLVHIRKKYACQSCKETIKKAALPTQPIPKSMASPNTLAHVLVSKFQDALPLYRQESIYQRFGIELSRATLSNWVIRSADLFAPLVELMRSNMIDYDIAYADETPLQVLHEPEREASQKSYMWLFSGGPPDKRSVVYRYASTRSQQVPITFLDGFSGYLHCDGYQAYDALSSYGDIIQVGCWFHARRKFMDAKKLSKKRGLAHYAVELIRKLSKIEKELKEQKLGPTEIKQLRAQKSKPLLDTFKTWLNEKSLAVPPESTIGKAIGYTLRQWHKLQRFLDDGRLEMSNNYAERLVKPFVIGRKNWLFANTPKGAQASATIYSIIETCKLHNVEPYEYLCQALRRLPAAQTVDELELLMPRKFKPQETTP